MVSPIWHRTFRLLSLYSFKEIIAFHKGFGGSSGFRFRKPFLPTIGALLTVERLSFRMYVVMKDLIFQNFNIAVALAI